MALVIAFLSAENEIRQLKDLLLADFGRLLELLLLSVNINKKKLAQIYQVRHWVLNVFLCTFVLR